MKRILLLTISSGLLYLTLSSNAVGPASMGLNATGSPGSGSCGGCHGGGPGTTTAAVEIRKLSSGNNGPIVSQYMPDTNYIIKIVGNHATLMHFGFQLTALKNGNTNAGTFSSLPANTQLSTVSAVNIVEHSGQLPKTNNQFESSFHWKAPVAGTGQVTFYGIINAVDNNNQVGGDKPSPGFTLALSEAAPTNVKETTANTGVRMYPNPFTDKLNISLDNVEDGAYAITVFDINGKLVSTENVATIHSYETSINTSAWAKGLYYVQLKKDKGQHNISVVKQ